MGLDIVDLDIEKWIVKWVDKNKQAWRNIWEKFMAYLQLACMEKSIYIIYDNILCMYNSLPDLREKDTSFGTFKARTIYVIIGKSLWK